MREQGAGGETREAVNVRGDVYIRAMVFPPGRRGAGAACGAYNRREEFTGGLRRVQQALMLCV